MWHQRKVVQSLSPAFYCYSKPRSSADKTATKSCPIPPVCFQNTCTNVAAAAELAKAEALSLLSDTHNTPVYPRPAQEHLSPPRGMAWNDLQPCQAHDLASKQEPNCSSRKQWQCSRGQGLISQKQTLRGDRRAAKVIACHLKKKKKRWKSTNWGQNSTKKRLGMFINIKLLSEQNSVKPRKYNLVQFIYL